METNIMKPHVLKRLLKNPKYKELEKERDDFVKNNPEHADDFKILWDHLLYGKAFYSKDKDGNFKHIPICEKKNKLI